MVTSSGTEINMALDFGLGYKTFTYNLVKHIDIFFIKNLVWATSLNFPISSVEIARKRPSPIL
jgi:hypothetical protein